jgi:ABC-2 type transport system ATP-binding protein
MAMLEARDLSMRFGSVHALEGVSFHVDQGEILGLLGPNGAGKTTAMRILTTYLTPTSGSASVAGYDVVRDPIQVRRRIGYLPETAPLYPDMEVREYLDFVGRGRGLGPIELKGRTDFVVQACELGSVFRRPILELSKGFRQRVGLAQALIHNPEILILDEPTSGLDPLQILGIRDLLRSLVREKKTLIFSTHILQEVNEMSDRVVIVREGRVVADGTIDEIRARVPEGRKVVVVVDSDSPEIERGLQELQGKVRREASRLEAEFAGSTGAEIFAFLKDRGWPVREVREERPSLEDAFVFLNREAKK